MPAAPHRTAPAPLKVIAWTWIISAFLVGGDEVLGALASRALGHLDTQGLSLPPQFMDMAASATKFGALDAAQIALGVVGLWAGIALLRLHAWARTAIEVLTWLTLAYTVERGVAWTWTFRTMSGELARDAGLEVDPQMLQSVGMATVIVLTLVIAVPFVLMIRYLRGPQARAVTAPPERNNAARPVTAPPERNNAARPVTAPPERNNSTRPVTAPRGKK